MNLQSNLEKMLAIMKTNPQTKKKVNDCFDALEKYQNIKETEFDMSLVPQEDNLQLPNVFLRTKKIQECEKFILENRKSKDKYTIWNKSLEIVLKNIEKAEVSERSETMDEDTAKSDIEYINDCIIKYI
ncbi:hypothetical protein BDAP_002024 [Binucleata daphniae]